PWSSLFIGISLPTSQLPFKTTACAFGATSRKVTFFSGDTSGDTTRGPCGRLPSPGCEWEGPTDRNSATANPVRNLTLLMLPRLPCRHTPESAPIAQSVSTSLSKNRCTFNEDECSGKCAGLSR